MKCRSGLMLLLTPALSLGHPGNGIVAFSDSAVLTGDAVHSSLWKFEKGKSPQKLKSGFHCHWVTRGLDGRLYAETLSRREGSWKDTVYRLDSKGENPVEIANGPEGAFGIFAVGRSGEIIHQSREGIVAWSGGRGAPFRKSGKPAMGSPALGAVQAFYWGPGDDLYLADGSYIRRAGNDGSFKIVARIEGKVTDPLYAGPGNSTRIWGLAVDPKGVIFAAVPSNGKVFRIDPSGDQRVISRSEGGWAATGVAVHGSTVFLLECRTAGNKNFGPRVRAMRANGTVDLLGEAS